MPTDKKRINLTLPLEVYDRVSAYREAHGILNDASACLQLIHGGLVMDDILRSAFEKACDAL